MRYFTDGARYLRLHIDETWASSYGGPEYWAAKMENWNAKRGAWVENDWGHSAIAFTGDWAPCKPPSWETGIEEGDSDE